MSASRAAKQLIGYFCGYTTKRQVVGKYELDQAASSMNLLGEALKKEPSARQLARVTNRMLSDLQCRGMLRPATEEMNLAANSVSHDVMNAEFIRTFQTQSFQGRRYLERLEWELKHEWEPKRNSTKTTWAYLPPCRNLSINSSVSAIPHVAAYGFRGRHPSVYFLSPWEFCMYIRIVKLWPPKHPANQDPVLTEWTDEGLAYYEAHKDDEPSVELTPGVHWKVIEPEVNLPYRDYITYPDYPELKSFRHEWIMVLQARPFVPQPSGAPMPEKRHTSEERSRILNLYLRPWVLEIAYKSAHVPLITELNTVHNYSQITQKQGKRHCKTASVLVKHCSYRQALYVGQGNLSCAYGLFVFGSFFAVTTSTLCTQHN